MADELTQEAEEKYFNHKMMDFQGFYPRHYYCLGYLDSAEPREKRIAELEKENAELKSKNCWKTCEYAEPKSQWISQHIQDVEQLSKAKELLRKFLDAKSIEETCVAESEAEQFLNSEVEK